MICLEILRRFPLYPDFRVACNSMVCRNSLMEVFGKVKITVCCRKKTECFTEKAMGETFKKVGKMKIHNNDSYKMIKVYFFKGRL